MPLKRHFVSDIDRLFVLSEEAKEYVSRVYGFQEQIIYISPLGVNVPIEFSRSSESNNFNVVSVSFCLPVKRIDKIIKSIAIFASKSPSVHVNWTHIGDGPLIDELMLLAKRELGKFNNVDYEFLGNFKNQEVLDFILNNPIDCFLNSSESEGIPVSIMEAMAAGIPAIAPNVGGIAELVSKENGYIMSSEANLDEIARGLELIYERIDLEDVKKSARRHILENFNAAINYPKFISSLDDLVKIKNHGV
jgi:glycosyltransferase involved in cell wall biosynthesis